MCILWLYVYISSSALMWSWILINTPNPTNLKGKVLHANLWHTQNCTSCFLFFPLYPHMCIPCKCICMYMYMYDVYNLCASYYRSIRLSALPVILTASMMTIINHRLLCIRDTCCLQLLTSFRGGETHILWPSIWRWQACSKWFSWLQPFCGPWTRAFCLRLPYHWAWVPRRPKTVKALAVCLSALACFLQQKGDQLLHWLTFIQNAHFCK